LDFTINSEWRSTFAANDGAQNCIKAADKIQAQRMRAKYKDSVKANAFEMHIQ